MIAFIIATPLQLFNSVYILMTNHKNEKADFYIMDFAVDMDKYLVNLNKLEGLNNIYSLKHLKKNKGKYGVIKDYFFSNKSIFKEKVYSDLYTTWIGDRSTLIFNELSKNNNNIKLHFYEEGIGVYTQDICNYGRLISKMFRLFNLKYDKEYIEDVFVYQPKLLYKEIKQPPAKIAKIDKTNKEIKDTINKLFNYKRKRAYNEKIIYLENCFFRDEQDARYETYKTLDQISLLKRIEEVVGRENIIVRKHPITKGTAYESSGFRVDEFIDIPWELILLNGNFKDKILMTILSTAVLSPKIMFDEEPTVIILAKAYKNEFSDKEIWAKELWSESFEALIEKIKSIYSDSSKIIVPENFNELDKILEEII